MMTLYLLFEALEQGRGVERRTEIPVSSFAARQPPSKIGIKAAESIDVENAIRALTVEVGATTAAVAVAEFLGGTEEQFAAADDRQGAARSA